MNPSLGQVRKALSEADLNTQLLVRTAGAVRIQLTRGLKLEDGRSQRQVLQFSEKFVVEKIDDIFKRALEATADFDNVEVRKIVTVKNEKQSHNVVVRVIERRS